MKQKIALYVLLFLVFGSVAAEPINKPDNTAAAGYESRSHSPHLNLAYPRGVQMGPIRAAWSDGSASRPMLTPTRPGNIGLSRELQTALAQRITLCSELIALPGSVTRDC